MVGNFYNTHFAGTPVHSATSIDELLKVVADTASAIVPAQEVAIDVKVSESARAPRAGEGRTVEYRYRRPESTELGIADPRALDRELDGPVRMIRSGLEGSGELKGLLQDDKLVNLNGWLAAPLLERDGRFMGWIRLGEVRKLNSARRTKQSPLSFRISQ